MNFTHNNTLTCGKRAASLLAIVGLLLADAPVAKAASSWNPTLLVNTESFQTIDEGDSTTDVELRFGGTLNEKIFWDYETSRFEFTDDVHVTGNLTATGTIISDGAISTKANLTLNSDNGDADATLTFGNDGGAETIKFNNTSNDFEASDDFEAQGTASGRILHGTDKIQGSGTLITDGSISTKTNLTINSDNGAADAVLTFGSDGTAETLTFANTGDRFEFTDDLYTSGTLEVDGNAQFDGGTLTIGDASGDAVTVNSATWTFANDTNFVLSGGANGISFETNTLSIDANADKVGIKTTAPDTELEVVGTMSGRNIHAQDTLTTSGGLVWEGAASGASLWVSTFKGAGLVDTCDPTTGKLTWNSTTQRFVCGTDTGTTYSAGQGLTLTSTVFSLSPSFSGTALEILGTASGRVVHAQDELRSSGTILAHSDIKTRSDLTINSDNGGADAILTFGNDGGAETVRFNDTTNNFSFSDDIDVTGNVDSSGTISGDGNFTINEDNTAADAVLTFGSDGSTENLTFQNSRDRFEFSDDVKVGGNLSGSTLTVDGTVTFRGQNLVFPNASGVSGAVLRTDGAGNLSWTAGISDGSGDIISMHPEYQNVMYYQSGSTYIGQLALSGAVNSGYESTYQWSSTKSAIQDYWMSVRVRVPDNFVRWDPVKSLQLRYRTKTSTTSQNHITVRLLDTAGANVALTGNATLASTTYATANITGPSSAGTYTPGSYITILIKAAANSSGQANVGFLNVHWETKNP